MENKFAEKYKKTLQHREMDRQAKGAHVPKNLRRDALKKAKKK